MRLKALIMVGLFVCGAGCGASQDHGKFIPKEADARAALQAALDSWQQGQKPGTITVGSTTIEVVDAKWRAGQKLARYEIVTEEPGDGPRWFSVKLSLQKPVAELVVRYVVVGNAPLWVYREEDYKKMTGM